MLLPSLPSESLKENFVESLGFSPSKKTPSVDDVSFIGAIWLFEPSVVSDDSANRPDTFPPTLPHEAEYQRAFQIRFCSSQTGF